MSTSPEPSFVAETLAWCNEKRRERGMEPLERLPKGLRDDPRSCPCGKATGLVVWTYEYSADWSPGMKNFDAQTLPLAVTEFTVAFDRGELPQYNDDLGDLMEIREILADEDA